MSGDLCEAMRRRVLVCDGDVGAAAVLRGVPPRTVAEAAVTAPELLLGLYREYKGAGADVLQTGATVPPSGEGETPRSGPPPADLWSSAVRVCRQAAAGALVAAVIAPPEQVTGEWLAADLGVLYRRQLEVFADCGPDLLLFRGFSEATHLRAALEAVPSCAPPVAVTIAAGAVSSGPAPADLARAVAGGGGLALAAVGATGVDAADLLGVLRGLRDTSDLPLLAQWRHSSCSHSGRQAAELIAMGARIVGGACGMPPAEVAMIARAARALA